MRKIGFFLLIFLFIFSCSSMNYKKMNFLLDSHSIILTETAPSAINSSQIPDTLNALRYLTSIANSEIDIAGLYITHDSDKKFLHNLKKASKRGVQVRLLLNNSRFSRKEIYKLNLDLLDNVRCQFINIRNLGEKPYGVHHAKYVVVDRKYGLLGSANFSKSALKQNREVNLLTRNSNVVEPLYSIFNRDFAFAMGTNKYKNQKQIPESHFTTNETNLLLETAPYQIDSPEIVNILDAMTNLINKAHKSIKAEIYLYTAAFSNSPYMQKALKKAKDRGVNIEIIFNNRTFAEKNKWGYFKYKQYRDAVKDLADYGISLKLIDTQKLFRKAYSTTHTKMVIVDDKFCLIGSNNWARSSVKENRELAIFTKDPYVLDSALLLFKKDWKFSKPFTPQN